MYQIINGKSLDFGNKTQAKKRGPGQVCVKSRFKAVLYVVVAAILIPNSYENKG